MYMYMHSKYVLKSTRYERREHNNSKVELIEMKTPIEVLFEGVNLDLYKALKPDELKSLELRFCLLKHKKVKKNEQNFLYIWRVPYNE